MNHNVLRSTGKIVVSYGRSAVVFNKRIRVDVPVNPLLLDCDQPSFVSTAFATSRAEGPQSCVVLLWTMALLSSVWY
jgi:hypothetical protein